MAKTTVTAPDIMCDGCANAIKKAVGTLPGVSGVDVDINTKQVTVTHDDAIAPRTAITGALDYAGFPTA